MMIEHKSIEQIIETGDYDEAINLAKQVQENMDRGRWIIGDLALSMDKQYGKDVIGEFAKDIQLSKARVQDYRTMSQYYSHEWRAYIDEHFAFNWSILRIAKRFKEIESSIDFLHRCSQEDVLTVDGCAHLAKELLGVQTKEKPLAIVEQDDETGQLILRLLESIDDLEIGKTYKLSYKELDQE